MPEATAMCRMFLEIPVKERGAVWMGAPGRQRCCTATRTGASSFLRVLLPGLRCGLLPQTPHSSDQ